MQRYSFVFARTQQIFRVATLSIACWIAAVSFGAASAQSIANVELEKRQGAEYRLTAFGPDLMGDGIDPHTGSISFSQTDVSLPGNFPLEVAVRRKRRQGLFYAEAAPLEFGDWQIDVPRIHTLMAASLTWTNRCSTPIGSAFPAVFSGGTMFEAYKYSNGLLLEAPGAGGEQLQQLQSPISPQWPAGTVWASIGNWRVTCIAAQNGGEGFLAYSPRGDQYRFDRYSVEAAETLGAGTNSALGRNRHTLLATRVTDVSGNTVDYSYDASNRLTRIEASDGRRIDLNYSGSSRLIQSVTANPGTSYARTWTYGYGTVYLDLYDGDFGHALNNALISATLPDGRAWSFNMGGMSANPGQGRGCTQYPQTITVVHPYGTVGSFNLSAHNFRQSLDQRDPKITCSDPRDVWQGGNAPPVQWTMRKAQVMSVSNKTLSGPNLPPMTWTYQYENDAGAIGSSGSDRTNWTNVTDPNGHVTTYYHFWTLEAYGGKLDRAERRATSSGPLLETTRFDYVQEAMIGAPVASILHNTTSLQSTYVKYNSVQREGDTSFTQTTYDNNWSSATYSFGNPLTLVRGSSLGGSRTEIRTYEHNKTVWALGLLTSTTIGGKTFDSNTYDANAHVYQHSKFGTLAETFAYHSTVGYKGALASVTNALNQSAYFNNWKRGQPQQVIRNDGTSISRVLDDNGWVRSQTDAKGITTAFNYNASGWLTYIDVPSPWADATLAYAGMGTTDAYSIATIGTKETVVWYDAFLRPYRVRTRPLSGGGETSYTKTTYDGLGRTIFTSLPSTTFDPTAGIQSTFDALGRMLTATDTVTLGISRTDYLSGGRLQVTDPKGNVATTTRRFYGSPDTAEVTRVDQPMGVASVFDYDAWGNMTSLNQSGVQNGYSSNVTRLFWYDSRNRLCRHRAPELGDELFGYDALDRLNQKASGQSAGTDCAAPPASVSTITQFDAMGRLRVIDYPSTTMDIVNTYDANGQLETVTRGGSLWTYNYNDVGGLRLERLQVDGRTYEYTYNYTPEGFLSSASMPIAGAVGFVPNGLGQSTGLTVGGATLASSGQYYVNGQMSALNLANGYAFSSTQNARQLIERSTTSAGASKAYDAIYTYDPVLPRITSITDNAAAGEYARGFSYDALGRLDTASGPWGSSQFTYDALNNLRRQVLGSRTIDINYDGNNRVNQYNDSATGAGWLSIGYDVRGNTTQRGALNFVYDYANQPTSTSGSANGSYVYDGHLKRVKETVNGQSIYSVYSRVTGKIAIIDNVTTGERTALLDLGPVSMRWKATGLVEYTHLDHLGSPISATNSGGTILWRESYLPFGGKRLNPTANRDMPGYTGHVDDDATGLTYMQARYFDPVLGRFLSTDPIGYRDQLSLYAYVGNDPINKADPTGEAACNGAKGCLEATNYKPNKADKQTVTQAPEIDAAATSKLPSYETTGSTENAVRFDKSETVTNDQGGTRTEVTTTQVPSTSKVNGKVIESTITGIGGADSVGHSHPNDKSDASPGPGDDKVVNAGKPNNIVHNGNVIVLEKVSGQFRARVLEDKNLTSKDKSEIQRDLNEFQRRTQ